MLVLHTKNSIKAKIRRNQQSQLQISKTAGDTRNNVFFYFTKMAKYVLCENCRSDLLVMFYVTQSSKDRTYGNELLYWLHFKVHFY